MKFIVPFFMLVGSSTILYGVCSAVLIMGKLKKDRNNVESIEYLAKNPDELMVLKRPAGFVVVGLVLFMLLNLIQRFF